MKFEIALTTIEYFKGVFVSEETVTYYRRYKTRKASERKAAEFSEIISIKNSPVKCITTAVVRHVF
ncbi:TPA: hypothetical protein MD351_004603 [Escherichia coli]|nr:hypothetical protein [Escherichia coli]HBA9839969.1 hypothetical protein [Escherichia coli]HBV6506180.1 hypothetical protein [Escherichia coli]